MGNSSVLKEKRDTSSNCTALCRSFDSSSILVFCRTMVSLWSHWSQDIKNSCQFPWLWKWGHAGSVWSASPAQGPVWSLSPCHFQMLHLWWVTQRHLMALQWVAQTSEWVTQRLLWLLSCEWPKDLCDCYPVSDPKTCVIIVLCVTQRCVIVVLWVTQDLCDCCPVCYPETCMIVILCVTQRLV